MERPQIHRLARWQEAQHIHQRLHPTLELRFIQDLPLLSFVSSPFWLGVSASDPWERSATYGASLQPAAPPPPTIAATSLALPRRCVKVCPVGGPTLSSDATVLHAILDGLKEAGVTGREVIVYNRYRQETLAAGIDKWIPPGVRMEFASPAYNEKQLDMDGYDPDRIRQMQRPQGLPRTRMQMKPRSECGARH